MASVLVGGAIANKHLMGGEAWVRLSWLLGLRRLGFDVFFVEQLALQDCVDDAGKAADFGESVNLAYFDQVMEAFGLAGSAALVLEEGPHVHGASWEQVLDRAEGAQLLVNISGHLSLEPVLSRVARRAYIDIDPGFTQIWAAQGQSGARLAGHDFFFTIAENIAERCCSIPTGDLRWRTTRQPVVLDQWPVAQGRPELFTTVASWRSGYGRVSYGGVTYGLKLDEFRKVMELPRRAPQTFELALDIHPDEKPDLAALRRNGWRLVDPRNAVPDPETFRSYVQRSGAEFSVAQGIYVDTWSGWFSDRTARYLATGKPVLVQDTGFSRSIPVGDGLLAFRTLEEAVAGAERIASDYPHHARAARQVAEECFDSDLVLRRLVDDVGVSP